MARAQRHELQARRFQKQTVPVKQLYQRKGLCAIISAVPEVHEVFHNTQQVRKRLLGKCFLKVCHPRGHVGHMQGQ